MLQQPTSAPLPSLADWLTRFWDVIIAPPTIWLAPSHPWPMLQKDLTGHPWRRSTPLSVNAPSPTVLMRQSTINFYRQPLTPDLHLQVKEFRLCLQYWLGLRMSNEGVTCPVCQMGEYVSIQTLVRRRPSVEDGTTFSQSPACGREVERTRALDRVSGAYICEKEKHNKVKSFPKMCLPRNEKQVVPCSLGSR